MASYPGIHQNNLFLGAGNGFSTVPFAYDPVPDVLEDMFEEQDGTMSSTRPEVLTRSQAVELNYLWQGYQGGPGGRTIRVNNQGSRKYIARLNYQTYFNIKASPRGWESKVSSNTQSYGMAQFAYSARPPVVILNGGGQQDVRGPEYSLQRAFNGLSGLDANFTYGSFDKDTQRQDRSGFSGFLARDSKLAYSSSTYRGPGNRGIRIAYFQYSEVWSRKPPARRFEQHSVDPPFAELEIVEKFYAGRTQIPYWVRRNSEEGAGYPPALQMLVGRGGLGI